MDSQLHRIEQYLPYSDSLNATVSKVNIAWHLDHSLKVINQVCSTLKNSNPLAYKRKLNFTRTAVFIMGSMPRGRGVATKSVTTLTNIKIDDILFQLEEAKQKLAEIDTYSNKSNFSHSIFGQLNKRQTKKFLKIHTRHHLKIIADILKK